MTTISIYGIKNCDTMKKALKWLNANNVDYVFYDYKKEGVDQTVLEKAINEHGWENVINRRGTTWRKLSEEEKDTMNVQSAIEVALENPSIIKRPLALTQSTTHLGFNEDLYTRVFLS